METNQSNWIEEAPNYWVHQDSQWVVRDYFTEDDTADGWIILDDNNMMISSEWKETKEECMEEVEFILAQEKKHGFFIIED